MANATIAKLLLERNTTLAKTGVASAEALDNAKAQFNAASARVAALDATIAKKTLLAPFDASTGLHELKQGQYLPAGNVITRLVGIDTKIWVDFSLPQQQASLTVGDSMSLMGIQKVVLLSLQETLGSIRSRVTFAIAPRPTQVIVCFQALLCE